MTLTMNVELPDNFSPELKHLLESLLQVTALNHLNNTISGVIILYPVLQRDVDKRLGCGGQGAEELKTHPFFNGVDWVQVVYQQKIMMIIVMMMMILIVMIMMMMRMIQ